MQILSILRALGLRTVMSASAVMAAANRIAEDQNEVSQVKSGQALISQLGKVADQGERLKPDANGCMAISL